jgi:hypothetical protein
MAEPPEKETSGQGRGQAAPHALAPLGPVGLPERARKDHAVSGPPGSLPPAPASAPGGVPGPGASNVDVDHFTTFRRDRVGAWLVFALVLLQLATVWIFSSRYYQFILQYVAMWKPGQTAPAISPFFFVSASIVWFAFCALFLGLLAKLTFAVLAEVRLANSRNYLGKITYAFFKIGIPQETYAKFVEHGVFKESAVDAIDPKALTPIVQVFESAKGLIEAVRKKD